jgi:hypothetical protein
METEKLTMPEAGTLISVVQLYACESDAVSTIEVLKVPVTKTLAGKLDIC